jgi:hypothetical protein
MTEGTDGQGGLYFFTAGLILIIGYLVFALCAPAPVMAPTKTLTQQMPTMVDVNGINWRIQTVTNIGGPNSGTMGLTDCSIRRIWISDESKRKPTVLMHELTHAAVCMDALTGFKVNNMYYNSESNDGHEGIYRFTNIWAEILIRNPKLALYESGQ